VSTRPTSYYLAPVLLGLGVLLAAGNWLVEPARAVSSAAAMTLFAGLAVVWGCSTLFFRQWMDEDARRNAGDSIRHAVAFGGLIMVCSLAVKLATALGAVADPDLARRMSNVTVGLLLAYLGNGLPKMLTPLSVLQCDGTRVQAFQRFAGRTWVLTGIAFATVWLLLPLDLARPLSLVLLACGMVDIVAQIVRLRRAVVRCRPV
jgi:hypothetical protein